QIRLNPHRRQMRHQADAEPAEDQRDGIRDAKTPAQQHQRDNRAEHQHQRLDRFHGRGDEPPAPSHDAGQPFVSGSLEPISKLGKGCVATGLARQRIRTLPPSLLALSPTLTLTLSREGDAPHTSITKKLVAYQRRIEFVAWSTAQEQEEE